MAYEVWLPSCVYSKIPGAYERNIVSSLEVLHDCIKVGNYYIPISMVLFIEDIS